MLVDDEKDTVGGGDARQDCDGRTVSHPGTGFVTLLGLSAELGVEESQTIGDFNEEKPGPAAADVSGAIAGPSFDVTSLQSSRTFRRKAFNSTACTSEAVEGMDRGDGESLAMVDWRQWALTACSATASNSVIVEVRLRGWAERWKRGSPATTAESNLRRTTSLD